MIFWECLAINWVFDVETQDRLRKLELLNEAGRAMNSVLDTEDLLDKILVLVEEVFHLKNCAILIINPDHQTLSIRKARGYLPEVLSNFVIKLGVGVTGWVAETGKAELIDDVSKDSRYIPGIRNAASEMAAPLQLNSKIIGVLDAESEEPNAFDSEDLALFSVFASQAATALNNAQLYDELSRRKRELEARVHELTLLHQASNQITSILDIDVLLHEILRIIDEAFHYEACAILLKTGDNDELTPRAARGYPAEVIRRLVVPIGHGVTGMVAQTGVPLLVPDVTQVSDYIHGLNGGRCEMAVPLIVRGKIIGVIDAESHMVGAFSESDLKLFDIFGTAVAAAIENARLFDQTQKTYLETIRALAQALEARDSYTKGHSVRVTDYALHIAEAMNLTQTEKDMIQQAGLLHDIGKIGISDSILNKPAALSPEEWKKIRNHPRVGDNILGPIKFLEKSLTIVLHHHESFDGTGYPLGLKGEDIPIIARIISVADSFDAMTSDRPYRKAMPREVAFKELERNRGTQFDPHVVDAFLRLMKR
jgi:putative nucleotidyltransferase with HDIG domain